MRGRSPIWAGADHGERGRIRGDAGVHVVAVIETFRECVDTAELQAVTQAVAHIDLQTVVRADALGEPARCIGELWVGQGGVCGIVKSARGEVRRAGRSEEHTSE